MAICFNNSHLLIGQQNLIIYNINSQETKEINLEHTLSINQEEEKKSLFLKEESFIQTIRYNKNNHQYLITTDNKSVFILNDNFKIVRSFQTKRAISKATFDPENNVLIADKTGDVFIHKFNEEPECLLGHLSILLDIKISLNGRYIVTSDRDEKIRVSKYPNAYNIECFCLGHSQYVSNIELWRDLVISGSGDGTIRAWCIESGRQKAITDTSDYIDNSNGVLGEFKKNMAEDDMFVSCLPITNLQIVQLNEQRIIITASIYMLSKLHIYYLDYITNNDVRFIYANSIDFIGDLIDFYLSLDSIYVLTSETLHLYILKEGHFAVECCNYVDKFINAYKNIFKTLTRKDIKVLYKKTFDNVQDYLDRKKIRIDLKNQ